MADDWPDWLPTNLKENGVIYAVQLQKDGTFSVGYADPEGQTIMEHVTRDDLIHDLLIDYSVNPYRPPMKRGYVLRTRVQK
jgi:hypothetical protein